MSKCLSVSSTTFPHEDIHKQTLHSADGRTANLTDRVLISKCNNRHQVTKGTRHWTRPQLNEHKIASGIKGKN